MRQDDIGNIHYGYVGRELFAGHRLSVISKSSTASFRQRFSAT